MSFAKTMTAGAMAISMVLASSAAYADSKPTAAAPTAAASKLSLAGTPAMQAMRATNLKQKNSSEIFGLGALLSLLLAVGVGVGITAVAGGFSSNSP
jgi:D-arabinose 1-dehydrogenase-like Zn-dependent alcohol dehydrogenase